MERVNDITSIQNLSRIDYPLGLQFFLQRYQQQHQQQQQHHQQIQLQIQNQQQQILTQQQQQILQQQPSPVQSAPIITQLHNTSNGNGNVSLNNTTSSPHSSRNSSLAPTKSRNSVTNNDNVTISNSNTEEIELIDLITCKLCKGYLIDATTLDLCMHSFCRRCALGFIKDKHMCPECNLEIKDKRPRNRLKPDITLQNIVYKLVPGLYEKEMARRREFYAARPAPTPRYKSEMFGDIPPAKSIKPDDMLNISLTWIRDESNGEPIKTYLLCRADSTMLILKKLVIGKFGLDRPIKFYYGNSEILFDLTAIMDVAATFDWSPENKVLSLNFKEDIPVKLDSDKKSS